jgi:hypothetical protein
LGPEMATSEASAIWAQKSRDSPPEHKNKEQKTKRRNRVKESESKFLSKKIGNKSEGNFSISTLKLIPKIVLHIVCHF